MCYTMNWRTAYCLYPAPGRSPGVHPCSAVAKVRLGTATHCGLINGHVQQLNLFISTLCRLPRWSQGREPMRPHAALHQHPAQGEAYLGASRAAAGQGSRQRLGSAAPLRRLHGSKEPTQPRLAQHPSCSSTWHTWQTNTRYAQGEGRQVQGEQGSSSEWARARARQFTVRANLMPCGKPAARCAGHCVPRCIQPGCSRQGATSSPAAQHSGMHQARGGRTR